MIMINLNNLQKTNCLRCLANSTISSLKIDQNQICQFCKMHDEMEKEYPLNNESENELQKIAKQISVNGKNNKYDCVVGVSGGKDSS